MISSEKLTQCLSVTSFLFPRFVLPQLLVSPGYPYLSEFALAVVRLSLEYTEQDKGVEDHSVLRFFGFIYFACERFRVLFACLFVFSLLSSSPNLLTLVCFVLFFFPFMDQASTRASDGQL